MFRMIESHRGSIDGSIDTAHIMSSDRIEGKSEEQRSKKGWGRKRKFLERDF